MESTKPILLCGKGRGSGQPIRCLLYYIGVQFLDVFVTAEGKFEDQAQKSLLPQGILITQEALPYLIHEDLCVSQIYSIETYICRRFQRQDLLGKNLRDQALINQLITMHMKNKSQHVKIFFQIIRQVQSQPENQVQILTKAVNWLTKSAEYLHLVFHFQQKTNSFILGYMTILDFNFYEACFYLHNIFGQIKSEEPLLRQIANYKQFFQNVQDCYKKHKQALESYKIMFQGGCALPIESLKKIWCGDPKFLQ